MDELKMCRICLISDVKMYNLESHPINLYYNSVTGNNLLTIENCPPYACYECAALLKKCYMFKQKSRRSYALLNSLIDHNKKISSTKLKQFDRQTLGLCSNLSTYSMLGESVQNFLNSEMVNKDEPCNENVNPTADFMKEDLKNEDVMLSPMRCLSSGDDDDELVSEHKLSNCDEMEGSEDDDLCSLKELKDAKEVSALQTKTGSGAVGRLLIGELAGHITVIKLSLKEQIEEMNKRKESSNYINSPFKCNLCYKGFLDTATLELHLRKHSPSTGPVECPLCKIRFKIKSQMRSHLRRHERKYVCNYCPHVSSLPNQAKNHLLQHKGITYTCKHCGSVFTVRTSYLSHLRIKHPSEFICNICGCSYINEFGLKRHKTLMHKDVMEKSEELPIETIYCEICDVNFVSRAAYKRHMVDSSKHVRNINDCPICGETFTDEAEMKQHRRKEHQKKRSMVSYKTGKNLKWPGKCEHCTLEFQNGREYWMHCRFNHPDMTYPTQINYVCHVCGKIVKSNANLIYHRRTHTGDRPYKCTQCHKGFYTAHSLQVHEHSHSDLRPFVCDICHKGFKFKNALKRHLSVHTGEKPYQCEICGKAFTTSSGRKIHINTVHFRQPETFVSRKRKKRNKNGDTQPQN